jgi:pimeloyl-CoA dehydrogenase small subunit
LDFTYTEEQTLLRNSVERFVLQRYDFDTRRKILKSESGWREDLWLQMAELGLLAIPFTEEEGGLSGGATEINIVMEEFGRGLLVEPYLSTVVLGGGFLRHGGTKAQKAALIPRVIAGDERMAFAYAERQSRYDLADIRTSAKKSGASFVLNGTKIAVVGAPQAKTLVVSARTAGGAREARGLSLFLVDKAAKGVSARDYRSVDGTRASDVTFENVAVPAENVLSAPDEALALIERVCDEATIALCVEATGAMKALNSLTTDYSKTRQQFGQPIGRFQVVQHRLVDMFMAYEQSVSLTLMASLKLGESEAPRKRAVSAAKVQIGQAGRFIGQSAVQLHGGIGMTDELSLGHYFKRLTMIDTMFGNADHHLKRFSSIETAAAA